MSEITKISLKVGNLEFSGEGKESWLEKQLDKLMSYASSSKMIKSENILEENKPTDRNNISISTLASFLGEKNAKTTQTRKFLATAAFLQLKGNKSLKTV